jgi:hypothetical protein
MTLKALARLGDPNPLVYGGLLVVLTCVVLGRAHAFRVFAYTAIGAYGLEVGGKLLFPQGRPSLLLGQSLSAYPSGTAVRALVLGGTLLVIGGPVCRWTWQRLLLGSVVVGWPMLMAVSVVSLGWHAPSEAVGGQLLGTAWLSVCLRLCVRHCAARPVDGASDDGHRMVEQRPIPCTMPGAIRRPGAVALSALMKQRRRSGGTLLTCSSIPSSSHQRSYTTRKSRPRPTRNYA